MEAISEDTAPFCNKGGSENNGAVVLVLKEFRYKLKKAVNAKENKNNRRFDNGFKRIAIELVERGDRSTELVHLSKPKANFLQPLSLL